MRMAVNYAPHIAPLYRSIRRAISSASNQVKQFLSYRDTFIVSGIFCSGGGKFQGYFASITTIQTKQLAGITLSTLM
ncbi:MAG: hypothetical protein ABS43_06240 [Bordetella sp. SCN 67-23]|nr:MAG: hypothetical protein ABS43_06240 [Bordetella sp. SCN 67-23]OJW88652.1 MAG: hypothetical protein BGO71_04245 [Burkholderiales bacterium 67-32]